MSTDPPTAMPQGQVENTYKARLLSLPQPPTSHGQRSSSRGLQATCSPAVGATRCKYVVDRWERKKAEQFEHYKKGGTGDTMVERNSLL